MRTGFTLMTGAMLGLALASYAAQPEMEMVDFERDSLTNEHIYFQIGSTTINPTYQNNGRALQQMGAALTDTTILAHLDSVQITATASPDGSYADNQRLARHRAQAVKTYITHYYPHIAADRIHTYGTVENWQLIRPMLTSGAPYRAQITAILDLDLPTSATENRLKGIDNGKAWEYTQRHYLPQMRTGATCVVYTSRKARPEPATPQPEPQPMLQPAPQPAPQPMPQPTAEPSTPVVGVASLVEPMATTKPHRPLFAVKTNLLYDALTALNIEIEVPIGSRWSIAGEYIFPWWLSNKKQHCLQSLSGYLEGRYWLGDRTQHRQLTGWFLGLYTGGGYYDVEWNGKGYQGEFCVPVALSAGYAHAIGRNLSMEYSLGVGYMRTAYRRYAAQSYPDGTLRLIRKATGTYDWIGPTKIKVSLVWMINTKRR